VIDCHQLLTVTTANWNDFHGQLKRYERTVSTEPWKQVGTTVPVVVGRAGLGWGRGVFDREQTLKHFPDTPLKKEGDGRAPAGIYLLDGAFGHDLAATTRLPYRPLHEELFAVDDSASSYYNRIVDRRTLPTADWNSAETLFPEPLYKWGIVVAHNTQPPIPNEGSCIFIHLWRSPDSGTSGCTAMEESHLITLLEWLDPVQNPLLVQLPQETYSQCKAAWRLP
jgi:D-alanyl-D-alanine dipeptidase